MSLLLVCSFLSVFAHTQDTSSLEKRRRQLNDLLAERWEYTMRTNPEYASILGDKRFNDKLSDYSYEAVLKDQEQTRNFLARFQAIDTTGFPEQEQLNKELMVHQLRDQVEGMRFKAWQMPVDQFNGFHLNVPQLVPLLPFTNAKEYDDYVARLKQLPAAFAQVESLMRMGMKEGRMPPRILLEQVVKQSQAIGSTKPEESAFARPIQKFPDGISASDQARLREAVLGAIRDYVNPTYAKFTKFVAEEYVPKGRPDPGAWSLPDGEAYYAYLVKQKTTTSLTPEQIHQIGLQQVAADRAEMEAIAKKLGFADLKTFEASLPRNSAIYPKSRKQILDAYQKHIDEMWGKLPELFGRLPKAKLTIVPVEEFREKQAAAAEYQPGTPDGSRPGRVVVNTGDYDKRNLVTAEGTAYHEGVPGHHMQIAIAQELPALPPFRQHAWFTAYGEGWALYSERLGKETGFYRDPYSDYGRLENDLLRAIRLVVDTGFHYKRWTRQQVIDYFHNNSAINEPDVQAETDRYIAIPGQALGYKIGQLKMIELRERAKKELGEKFDIRKFHDEILGAGALPLDVLEKRITAWIGEQNSATPGQHAAAK